MSSLLPLLSLTTLLLLLSLRSTTASKIPLPPNLPSSIRRINSVPPTGTWATITFSADDSARLFINGRLEAKNLRSNTFTTVRKKVYLGDVIGVLARNKRGARGVLIDISYSGAHFPANSRHWKAHKFRKAFVTWKKKSFSSCFWRPPLLMSATSGIVIAQGFPYQRTGAKYVWTARQGKGTLNKIMLRHVIGGERCRPEQLQSKNMATISFAADNRAWVFLNGRLLAKNFRPRTVKTIRKGLKPGDVIAVGAKNMGGASGVIVDVFYKGDHFATGRGHWKARKYRASLRRRWRLKQYSSCKWKDPVIVDTAANLITAPQFPSSSGARYVWAPPYGRGMKSASLLRFVVGGEKCPRKTNVAVGGQSEGEKERFCRCKMTTGREGTCYDMVSATRKRGRCKVRQCETKYECVANSAKGSKVCIRRVASEKVIPSGKPGRCIRVGSDSIFYVPYE